MKRAELEHYCLNKAGAKMRELGHPQNIQVYSVAGKQFAYFKTSEPERWRFSIRVLPERFLELTDMAGVKPARYMGRFHWVSIVRVEDFDEDYLIELIDWSHARALKSLSKRQQRSLTQSV